MAANKTAISSASDDHTRRRPTYRCLGEESEQKWKEFDVARNVALENGDFETAMACVEKVAVSVYPLPPKCDRQNGFVECERKRIKRLKDPLHNDPPEGRRFASFVGRAVDPMSNKTKGAGANSSKY